MDTKPTQLSAVNNEGDGKGQPPPPLANGRTMKSETKIRFIYFQFTELKVFERVNKKKKKKRSLFFVFRVHIGAPFPPKPPSPTQKNPLY